MSGAYRRLLWAATCLAALCVSAAQSNSSIAPNVTDPPTPTSKAVPTTLTPTKPPPGGRPPHGPSRWGPAQHGRPAGVRRPDGWRAKAAGELGRGAAPAPRALPAGAPSPKRLGTPRRSSGRRRGLLPRWQLGETGRGDAPRSWRGAQTLGSWDRLLSSPRGFSGGLK